MYVTMSTILYLAIAIARLKGAAVCITNLNAHRYYAKPFIKIQKVHNLTVAFKFITEVERISLGDIGK